MRNLNNNSKRNANKVEDIKADVVTPSAPSAAELAKDAEIAALRARLANVVVASKATTSPTLEARLTAKCAELALIPCKGWDAESLKRFASLMLAHTEGTTSEACKGGSKDIAHVIPATLHYRATDAYGITYSDWTIYKNILTSAGLFFTKPNSGNFIPTPLAMRVYTNSPLETGEVETETVNEKGKKVKVKVKTFETFPIVGSPKTPTVKVSELQAQLAALLAEKAAREAAEPAKKK
jgi:hypothetical protein